MDDERRLHSYGSVIQVGGPSAINSLAVSISALGKFE